MPKILPISDLRNYTEVLSQVDGDKPVYLTRNGRGTYVISKVDNYGRAEAVEELFKAIQKGEKSLANDEGVASEEVAKKYTVSFGTS